MATVHMVGLAAVVLLCWRAASADYYYDDADRVPIDSTYTDAVLPPGYLFKCRISLITPQGLHCFKYSVRKGISYFINRTQKSALFERGSKRRGFNQRVK